MTDIFLLEWHFKPPDLFEEKVEFPFAHGAFEVESGTIKAQVPAEHYPEDHSHRLVLHEQLRARFRAALLLEHKAYTLTEPTVARVHEGGRRDMYVFVKGVES